MPSEGRARLRRCGLQRGVGVSWLDCGVSDTAASAGLQLRRGYTSLTLPEMQHGPPLPTAPQLPRPPSTSDASARVLTCSYSDNFDLETKLWKKLKKGRPSTCRGVRPLDSSAKDAARAKAERSSCQKAVGRYI